VIRRRTSGRRLGDGFDALWLATGATALGAQVTAVALPLLAVQSLGASAAEVGLLATVQWLPFVVIALPLGVLFDRMRRRPLLIGAEVARAVVLLAIVTLPLAAALHIRSLLVLALLLGCCTVCYEIGYQSYLPFVVPAQKLDIANSRLSTTESMAQIVGPGLGGLLVQSISGPGAVGLQVLTSALSAAALARIKPREPAASTHSGRLLGSVGEGITYLRRERVLRWAVGFSALSNPFTQWILVLFTLDALRRLGLNAAQFGLILSMGAVGALVGSVAAPGLSRRFGALRICMICAAVDPVAFLVLPALDADMGTLALVSAAGAVFGVGGLSSGLSSVIVVTVRQLRVPQELRGRVNATTRMISYGSIALGAAGGGLAGQLFGIPLGLAIGACGFFLSTAWTLGLGRSLFRSGIRIDQPAPTGSTDPQSA
jgi:MFS family permease